MRQSVLIVEDESKMREFIGIYFRSNGYNVIEAENGEEGLKKFKENNINLIVLDIMMPKLDGFEVCREIRKNSKVPIIILTAVEEESDQIRGYELGADDYVTKPFKIKILLAKAKRLLSKFNDDKKIFKYKELKIDFDGREVYIGDKLIKFAPKEFELLLYLVENESIAKSRTQILEYIWGYDFEGENRVVDNHIKKIRNKLGEYSKLVKTVISVGYKFEV